jgi:uncharacterized protein YdaU (DUF1376 family)
MSAKPPAFQFYPQDYLASTRVAEMTLEEEGVYIRLLCYCWSAGSIPKDPERCARLAGKGCSIETATSVQRAFNEHPTDSQRLIHDRLEVERENQRARRIQAAEAGKESARRRKNTQIRPPELPQSPNVSNDRSTPVQQNVNPSSSSSSSDVYLYGNPDVIVPEKMRTPEVMSAAALWWSHLKLEYPHKLPEPNSPQMQAFWNDANRMGPKTFIDAVNWSAKNHWETLNERPDREQKGFGNGKPASPSSTAEREKAKLQRILSTGSS